MEKLMANLQKLFVKSRLTVFGVSLGLGLVVVMAAMWRQRRRAVREERCNGAACTDTGGGDYKALNGTRRRTYSPLSSCKSTARSRVAVSHASSTSNVSEMSSASAATITENEAHSASPHDLCDIGMETLQQAIECWEDAHAQLMLTSTDGSTAATDQTELSDQIKKLLEMSYHIQDEYERRCVRHADHLAIDSAIAAIADMDRAYEMRRTRSCADTDVTSDHDSFVSAIDLADLSDLETHRELFHHLQLYEAGLMELKHGHIPCRTLRTEMTGCLSDTEFLAKLHGIRFATELLLKDEPTRAWFVDATRNMLCHILVKSNKDTEEFVIAYDAMMTFLHDPSNHTQMADELRARGVKCISFYDVALDFFMMDAFDDLDNPPSSVTAVAQNRWLSNNFKETALNTAIWSVLKAKRKLLRDPNGFISHFYQISEHISPVLAWGFLGPDSEIKPLCTFFKTLVQGFVRDVFSFEKVRFTTLEHLADDILKCAKETEQSAELFFTS